MGNSGRGLQIQEGASLTADGLYIIGTREAGIFVVDNNTLFEARELVVSDTKEAACAANNTCPFLGGFGDGVVVLGGATVKLSDFLIKENERVGLFMASAEDTEFTAVNGIPTFEGKEGSVVDNEYGVNMKGVDLHSEGISIDAFACFDNVSTVDGCMCAVNLEIPNPTKEIENILGKEED